jgi:hypothetical protein
MKNTLKIANILSWFNLFFWGVPLLINLLKALTSFNPVVLGALVLFASIPLHSYAALQLHKSIRKPEVKLSHNTPAGIRFVGMIALFFGIIFLLYGIALLRNAPELLSLFKEQMPDYKEFDSMMTVPNLRRIGAVVLVLGFVTIINVILNLRLLRWYYLVRQSDVS